MESSTPDTEALAGASRRKSMRVQQRPETYNETTTTNNAKRKRSSADDDDVEMEDAATGEEDAESAEEESAADDRERGKRAKRPKNSRGKPTAKKAKTKGETVSLPIRPMREKTRRPKKAKPLKDAAAAEKAGGLYADVFARMLPLDEVTGEWYKRFKNHEAEALEEIVNFLLRCAGCDIKVDRHDIEDPDSCTSKLTDIQDEYQAQNITEYPLIAKGKGAASFKAGLSGFFLSFIDTIAQSGALFDNQELIENVQVWFSSMSSAANRAFRHTATVASNAIVSGLCDVGKKLAESAATALRLSETEQKKARSNKARVASIKEKAQEASQKRETLDRFLVDWFDTVFVHRYRDVDPRIRLDCVQALSGWIMIYPDLFFDGQHLRYLGWLLSDTSAPTRLEVVKQLHKMYSDQEKIAGLKTFTERFRPRMVEMATSDADAGVRASSVELLDGLRKAGLLEPDDIDSVGKLIFDSEPRVRKAVIPFFAEVINDLYESKLEDLGGQEGLEEALGEVETDESFETPRIAWIKLKCLAEIMEAYDGEDEALPSQVERGPGGTGYLLVAAGVESRFSLAAQALYDFIPEIKEWEVLAGYLLFDNSQGSQNGVTDDPKAQMQEECRLSEREEVLLLEVLNASIRHRLHHITDAGADKKMKRTKAQRQELLTVQEMTGRRLAVLIPKLLHKFGASPEAASTVLRLVHVIGLEVFQELRHDSSTFANLIDDINKQFMTHGAEDVVLEASAALLHAKTFEELGEVTEGKLQGLWEDTTSTLQSLNKTKDFSKRGNLSANMLRAVSNTVLRIGNLAGISDCTEALESAPKPSKPPIDLLVFLLRGTLTGDLTSEVADAEDALTIRTAKALLFYFMWKVQAMCGSIRSATPIADADLETLALRRDEVVRLLTKNVKERRGADTVRLSLAGILLDLHVLFSTLRQASREAKAPPVVAGRPAAQLNTDYLALALPVDPLTQRLMLRLLGSAQTAFAKKSRRNLGSHTARASTPDMSAEDAESDNQHDADDPLSESDADDGEAAGNGFAVDDADASARSALEAEQALCEYAGKLVLGILAGVLDEAEAKNGHGRLRRALEKNRTKLGANYKEVVAFLDAEKGKKSRRKGAAGNQKQKQSGTKQGLTKAQKSRDIITVSEDEDEPVEDDESEIQDDDDLGANVNDEDEADGSEHGFAKPGNEDILGD